MPHAGYQPQNATRGRGDHQSSQSEKSPPTKGGSNETCHPTQGKMPSQDDVSISPLVREALIWANEMEKSKAPAGANESHKWGSPKRPTFLKVSRAKEGAV